MSPTLVRDGDYAVLTLDRPQALNALSFAILQQIDAHVDTLMNWDVRGLIVVGAGPKAFCAGADIKELMARDLRAQHEGAALGQRVFQRIADLHVPSVAVIHGFAFGGGLELALACTFRVGTERAKLGLPEVKLGLIPGYGGTQRLPRLVGEARALEIIMSGRTVLANEAERIGLLNQVVRAESPAIQDQPAEMSPVSDPSVSTQSLKRPHSSTGTGTGTGTATAPVDPIALGKSFLAPMLQHGLLALSFARQAVQRGMQTTLEQGLRIERDLSTLAYRTADADEGMRAFSEKRQAVFKDA